MEKAFKKQQKAETQGPEPKSKRADYKAKRKALKEMLRSGQEEVEGRIGGFVRPVLVEGVPNRPIIVMSEDKKWVLPPKRVRRIAWCVPRAQRWRPSCWLTCLLGLAGVQGRLP